MTRLGLNQGTAGNVSVRYQDGMLITPTGIPYEKRRSRILSLLMAIVRQLCYNIMGLSLVRRIWRKRYGWRMKLKMLAQLNLTTWPRYGPAPMLSDEEIAVVLEKSKPTGYGLKSNFVKTAKEKDDKPTE